VAVTKNEAIRTNSEVIFTFSAKKYIRISYNQTFNKIFVDQCYIPCYIPFSEAIWDKFQALHFCHYGLHVQFNCTTKRSFLLKETVKLLQSKTKSVSVLSAFLVTVNKMPHSQVTQVHYGTFTVFNNSSESPNFDSHVGAEIDLRCIADIQVLPFVVHFSMENTDKRRVSS
jgi:hypothetical protein